MQTLSCPAAITENKVITLAHGGGGKYTSQLIQDIFLPAFSNKQMDMLHDGALLDIPAGQILFTTDSYVVQPIFFPGGDIGKLAVTGTVNDLAMCGAAPLFMSCSFIIEEGFPQGDLVRVVRSMQAEAVLNNVQIVTGDTKVIERQSGSNLFINTSGIGACMVGYPINPLQIKAGDHILLSGDVGRHGMAIMAERESFSFTTPLVSDCVSLYPMVKALCEAGVTLHCLRDLTRGGLATALVELAEASKTEFLIDETAIVVDEAVVGACEILGIDPLYVANEGRFVAFIPQEITAKALDIIKGFPDGKHASLIGSVSQAASTPHAVLRNSFGTERYLYLLMGDQLPRIC